MRRSLPLLGSLLVALALAAPAFAHGEIDSAIPPPDSKVKKAPDHLIINFTEAPTKDAVFKVTDGCGTNLIDIAEVQDGTGHVFLKKGGEPGKWKVSYRIVSSVDGHPTRGSYALEVAGKPDCGSAGGNAGDGNGGGTGAGGGGGDASGPTGDDDGGTFPVVPVALGAAGIVALAFLARRAAG